MACQNVTVSVAKLYMRMVSRQLFLEQQSLFRTLSHFHSVYSETLWYQPIGQGTDSNGCIEIKRLEMFFVYSHSSNITDCFKMC